MTTQEAKQSIGKPFKLDIPGSGLLHKWDELASVDESGTINGKFLSGHASNFRLKNDVPEKLRKQHRAAKTSNVTNQNVMV